MQDIMRTKNESIIAIDRGKKHIGLACVAGETDVVMPLGVVQHDATALYTLAHILAERRVTRVLVGYPSRVPHIQRAIDAFIRDLWFVISPDVEIVRVDEDYSSVEANAVVADMSTAGDRYKKTAGEDSLAAAVILERWLKA